MKILVSLFLGIVLNLGTTITPNISTSSIVKAEVPPYAKWGQLAMQKTKEKYPNAAITDYLHLGKVPGTTSSTEKFKLWLKEKDKEFGVLVDIEIDKNTERLIGIKFREVTR
ncbi:DUF3889 domain-containing protein [Pseudoneobacillus rhizosphaerae]|uniref:DUF3889 domain-containing protein n=1 Tax=Pseudoneobacillus rhizosphaerae TaxID=2880968 RepID=A0A9C7GCN2_9BACI|nr:DUF3889 domain-containing protein [Pseudoneobacillus rhizosphaerae]CAG9609956.1 hypothetical protein NEOCIP111885_03699 [Pseudoneobacillus rhizosphaerae]